MDKEFVYVSTKRGKKKQEEMRDFFFYLIFPFHFSTAQRESSVTSNKQRKLEILKRFARTSGSTRIPVYCSDYLTYYAY